MRLDPPDGRVAAGSDTPRATVIACQDVGTQPLLPTADPADEADVTTPADEDERPAALAALDLLDTPAEERFDRVTHLCTRLFGVSKAAVTLVDRDRVWRTSAAGMPQGVDRTSATGR